MSSYATLAQLYLYGAPARMFGSVDVGSQQAVLDARASYVDSKVSARTATPLTPPIDISIIQNQCVLAAYDLIFGLRGANPNGGSDENFIARYKMAVKFFDDVERQNTHPVFTPSTPGGVTQYPLPIVHSAPPRGW